MPKRKQGGIEFLHDGIPVSRHAIARIAIGDPLAEGFMTENDVVQIGGISKSTVRRWREEGFLTAKKVGKSWLYSRDSVAQAVRARNPGSGRH